MTLLVVAAVAAAGLWGVLSRREAEEPAPPPPGEGSLRAYPEFGPDSPYRLDVSQAPLDPNSPAMIRDLLGQVRPHYQGIAALNVYDYTASYYVVDENTPRTRVEFYDCQDKGYTPEGLFDGPSQFTDVPIPADARPATGSDKAMSLWSPSTDQLWEFWVMERTDAGWRACWGGRLDNVSRGPGWFPKPFGATATGIPMVATMLTVQDVASLRIEHALGLALPAPADWQRFRYPAQRSDGSSTSPDAIPEGARLRLDPAVDVHSLGLTPIAAAIAEAAQTYGFIVVDKAGAVAVIGESGVPEAQQTGANPWDSLLGGVAMHQQLRGFPWDRMQVVRSDVGVPSDAQTP